MVQIAIDGFFYDLLLLDIEMLGITGMELSIFRYVPKNDLENRLKMLWQTRQN